MTAVADLGVALPGGPFTGMRDSVDPTTAVPTKAVVIQNMYPEDPEIGGAVVGRPGFDVAGGQLGAAGVRTGQLVAQFSKKDGTEYTVGILGGKFYTYNWVTDAWTEVLAASDFSSASITLSTTAKCYATTYNDELVVSDGTNTPFAWDGTTNGGLTKLTAAPVFYGPQTVYFGKLVGVKDADRLTFVFSEENSVNTGYETGFSNAWTLGQTDQAALAALTATEAGLVFFRARAGGLIQGQVTTNFSSTGTQDALSSTKGTPAPEGAVRVGREVWFLNAEGWVHYIPAGGEPVPVWQDQRVEASTMPKNQIVNCQALYWPPGELVLFGYQANPAETENDRWLVFNAKTHEFAGLWQGYRFARAGIVKDANGVPRLMHIDPDEGYIYKHGLPDGTQWDDALVGNSQPIEHVIEGAPLGYDTHMEKIFSRIDLVFRLRTAVTITVAYRTPRGLSTPQTLLLSGGGTSLWDVFVWDDDDWSAEEFTDHASVGWNGHGRWVSPRVVHDVAGEEFGFLAWTVWYGRGDAAPNRP